jgi:cytoskeletal protein CcmA (bactofilin family)
MLRRGRTRAAYTYVAAGTTLQGTLHAVGRVRIDGVVRGEVDVDGPLEVGPGGAVEGPHVRARAVRVAGTVRADVSADEGVEVWRGGVLEGDVRAATLDVEAGARFDGRSVMPEPDAPRDALRAWTADEVLVTLDEGASPARLTDAAVDPRPTEAEPASASGEATAAR